MAKQNGKSTKTTKAPKRQQEIPGAERPVSADIDAAAQPYIQALYGRLAMQKKENELKEHLHEAMKAAKKKKYKYFDGEEGFMLDRNQGTEKLSVKRLQEQPE